MMTPMKKTLLLAIAALCAPHNRLQESRFRSVGPCRQHDHCASGGRRCNGPNRRSTPTTSEMFFPHRVDREGSA
jgi:hypothetical protein